MQQYNIPFYQKSSLKWHTNLLFLFCTIVMAACSIFFFIVVIKEDFMEGLFFGLFMLILSFCFAYILISVGILKKFYIEMTSEYIRFSTPFKTRTVYWREIYEAQVYEFNNNIMLSILLEKDINKKRKRTISNSLDSLQGVPPNSFQISLRLFKDIDPQRLLLTIGEQVNKVDTKDYINVECLSEDNKEYDNSMIKAIIASVFFSIISSIIYGFTIYKLEKNYVILPIFGCYLIISGFNKYYLEESFNLIIRLLLGLICLIQVPTAIIGAIIISEGFRFTVNDIWIITCEYFKYLFQNPLKQIVVIIIAIICFTIGAFKGRTRKEKTSLNIYE